ncbi:hypothetical protein GC175_03865 [bacterium]|nr:hypothetical protein [bacterium]
MYRRKPFWMLLMVLFAVVVSVPMQRLGGTVLAQDATPTPAAEEEMAAEEMAAEEIEPDLRTAYVHADLVRPGRLIMSARGNHWIYDSVAPLNGPNEAMNPLDAMLGALLSCGMFIYEAVGIEQEIEITHLSATATGELDTRGVSGAADVNPRLRSFEVTMNVDGPSADEAAMMAEAFSVRCPIYTTLAKAAPISITNVVDGEEQEPFATEEDPIIADDEADDVELQLGRPAASGRMVEFGRALISARGNHWIFDSVPPINGPNEEVNPLDALLGALPACGIMIYEAAARENDIPLYAVHADVEGDLDPRGVAGANVNPRIRAFRVTMHVDGPTMEEAEFLADEYRARCPIYTTFERSAPIELTNRMIGEGTAVLVTSFTYDLEADDYIAEVSPLTDAFAALDGQVWKIWTINEEDSRGGGIFLFENAAARQAFLDGELFGMVQAHPALSEFKVETYDVVRGESLATSAPLMAADTEGVSAEDVEAGVVLQITFSYNVPTEEFMAEVSPLTEGFAAAEGLTWKIWSMDAENSQFSGILYFADEASTDAFLESDLAETLTTHPALSDFEITTYNVMVEESLGTAAPIE